MSSMTFTFQSLPTTLDELKALPEADLSTPFKACALTIAVLNNYENSPEATIEMLNFLKGPQPMSEYDKQFLRDRLKGKMYVARSFFDGSSPDNNYQPNVPYTVTITEGAYAYAQDGYAMLDFRSSGADNPRQIKLRRKGTDGPWFLWENFALSDIRTPKADDPWA